MNDGNRASPYAGMGASGYSSGRYQGFGSSPRDSSPVAPSPSPKSRPPFVLPVNPYSSTLRQQEQSRKKPSKVHIPGRAGGSWDDDDDEKVMDHTDESATETKEAIINAFCSQGSHVPKPSELDAVMERLQCIKAPQLSAALSNDSAEYTLRSLLLTEWLLHRQPIPHLAEQLELVKHSTHNIPLKVQKLKLIADSDTSRSS